MKNGTQPAEIRLPTPEQIDSVLAFLPVFASPAFKPVVRMSRGAGREPYPIWSEEVRRFYRVLHTAGFVLDDDQPAWHKKAISFLEEPRLVAEADLSTLCKVFTSHVQRETFDEGHFLEMVASGHMATLLRRLRELRR